MKYNEFKLCVKECAQKCGIEEYELYYSWGASTSFSAYKGEIDKTASSDGDGACFRCIVGGKMGYASTELFSVEEAERIVLDAKKCAEILETEDKEFLFSGSEKYAELPVNDSTPMTSDYMMNQVIKLEEECYKKDSRIKNVSHTTIFQAFSETGISNSYGLDLYSKTPLFCTYAQATAEENSDVQVGFSAVFSNDAKKLNVDFVAEESTKQATAALGAQSIPTGKYKTVISNMQMATLLETFCDVFSADAAQKGMSLLAGKEGEMIASDIVTIVDDPFCVESCCMSAFDAEGVATSKKNVIEKGVFKTMLHNLKTADKAGVETTGNAYKASYKSKVSISPFAFYIKPSEKTFDEILNEVKNGVYITELNGMHAGANSVTGDFSLSASGFLVQDGKLAKPIKEITVAGNFFSVLKQIECVGNDFRFSMPSGSSQFGSPCVCVGTMAISGE